jgi:hypothetical protein
MEASAVVFIETAPDSEYQTICPAYPLMPFGLRDVPVVKRSWVGERLPLNLSIPGTSVFGQVTERVGDSIVPVGGATVTLDTGNQDPPSTTNNGGFYMICSIVGTDQIRTITARSNGFRTRIREILGGLDSSVDFDLARD